MTLPENSFKRTSLYVAATHVAFLVGLFVFSRLHFEVPFNPETVVWLDGGGGTGGDGVEAADAGAIPPTVPPRPGSEPDSEDLVLPPVNRVPRKHRFHQRHHWLRERARFNSRRRSPR
jgi:hypothetical protein